MWLIMFTLSYLSSMTSTLNGYITSTFNKNPLASLTSVISYLAGGVIVLPYAKLIDLWGRPQGFGVMVISYTMGVIMMAGCKGIVTFLVAQIFYQIGYNGINFSMLMFVADTCSLRNRAFAIAYQSSPFIITTYASGPTSEKIWYGSTGWRWGYGMWAIITPVLCFMLWCLYYYNHHQARKQGIASREPSGRTFWQSCGHYIIEFDIVGVLLIAAGLVLFLLPFNLYEEQPRQWQTPWIIALIVVGGCLIIIFALYEIFLAPITFIPWGVMKNPTVIFTYTMVAALYVPYETWYNSIYFTQLLQVSFYQSITNATYIGNIYTVVASFWSLVFGVIVRYFGRTKWHAALFAVPITILGVGLMIHFRGPSHDVGFLCMCFVFISVGGGTLVICEQVNLMAAVPQRHVAAVLSVETMISQVGDAIGGAISNAIWLNILPRKLEQYLPPGSPPFEQIYGNLPMQLEQKGAVRDAINRAYSDTHRIPLIVAVCMYVITLGSVLMWNDIDVRKMKKQQDRLF